MKYKEAVTYAVKNFSSVTFINRIKEEDFKHLNILKEIKWDILQKKVKREIIINI